MPTVTTHTMSNKKSAQDNILRGLFALALAWAFFHIWFLWLGLGESIVALNPAPEESTLHAVVELWTSPLLAVITATIFLALIVKLKPGFLSVPKEVTWLQLLSTLLATTAIIGILLPLLVLATTVLVPPEPHPENPQYIPPVFWITPFVFIPLAPAASILIAWMWIILRQPTAD